MSGPTPLRRRRYQRTVDQRGECVRWHTAGEEVRWRSRGEKFSWFHWREEEESFVKLHTKRGCFSIRTVFIYSRKDVYSKGQFYHSWITASLLKMLAFSTELDLCEAWLPLSAFMWRKCIYLNRLVTGQESRGRKIYIHERRASVNGLQRIKSNWLKPQLQQILHPATVRHVLSVTVLKRRSSKITPNTAITEKAFQSLLLTRPLYTRVEESRFTYSAAHSRSMAS